MTNNYNGEETLSKFDRLRASLQDVALPSRPSTIKHVQFTGKSETFVVQTYRHEDGDTVFIECMDENTNVTRLALPPKVSNAIASQRDSLTARRRSQAAQKIAKERKERGELPGFLRKKA